MTRNKIKLGLIGVMIMLVVTLCMIALNILCYGGVELALCISVVISLFFELYNISEENNIDSPTIYYYIVIGNLISYLIIKAII